MPDPIPAHWWAAIFRRWTWQMAWRDSRSQRRRLALYTLAIVAGLAALVAIRALKSTVQAGVDDQAKALLGSDLHITARQPLPPEKIAQLASLASGLSRETEFSSMLLLPKQNATRLVQVRGLDGPYPYYGAVLSDPPDAWSRLQKEGGILLEPAMLEQYGAAVGDVAKLGGLELVIRGTLSKPPPRSSRFSGFAPETYLRRGDLDRSGLLGERGLVTQHLHLQATPDVVSRIKRKFADENWRFETPESRRESLEKALTNLEDFLGLIALVALVLAALGVAGAMHAHLSRRRHAVAILRCLGCPAGAALAVFLVQALVLGLAGAIAGTLLGASLHAIAVAILRQSFQWPLALWPEWSALLSTGAAGFVVCAAFALLPLLGVRQIAPSGALREDFDEKPRPLPLLAFLLVGALLVTLSLLGTPHHARALAMDAALLASLVLLAGTARLLIFAARRIVRPGWPYLFRQGIANLYRPRNQTLLFLLSLGLGSFLLLTVLMTRDLLLQRVRVADLSESPNLYLIDVQPDQIDGVTQLIQTQGFPVLESAPMVTMRIAKVNGTPVRELEKLKQTSKWVLQREYRSTYRAQLNATEKIVAGAWNGASATSEETVPVSLEKEMAHDLGASVGDTLTLDIQGIPLEARISSLREVDWSKFNLNFFMLFPPGVLEGAPGFHVLTTRLPDGQSSGRLQRALVERFPNVTAIDLAQVLETVRGIVAKLTRAITLVAAFTVLAGIPILLGALWNGREQRIHESVLLRTVGASSRQVRLILLTEYAALGALSALSALLLAIAANWALAHYLFETPAHPSIPLLASATLLCLALSIAGGLAVSRGIAHRPPLEILRRIT